MTPWVVGWCKDLVVFGCLLGWLGGTCTSCMGFNFRVSTVVVVKLSRHPWVLKSTNFAITSCSLLDFILV